MKSRPLTYLLTAIFASLGGASGLAALDGIADSSTFDNRYNGIEIWDGSAFVNQWVQDGGATAASLSLTRTDLVFNNDANNGWLQHDNDATPWETASGKWTLEVSLDLNDTNPEVADGAVLWGKRDGNRGVLWIDGDSVNSLGGTEIAAGFDNTDGFHTYRVAFDPSDTTASPGGTHHVWRDDVLLSGSGVDLNLAGGNLSRLIVGDCCTSVGNPVDEYVVGYIRYQEDRALAPIPEPGALVLAGLALLGLLARRRP